MVVIVVVIVRRTIRTMVVVIVIEIFMVSVVTGSWLDTSFTFFCYKKTLIGV